MTALKVFGLLAIGMGCWSLWYVAIWYAVRWMGL